MVHEWFESNHVKVLQNLHNMITLREVTHRVITHKRSERMVVFLIVTLAQLSKHILRESLCFYVCFVSLILIVICHHDHDI